MATGDYRQSWERVPEGPKPEGTPRFTPMTEEVRDQWASSPVYGYRDPMPTRFAEFDRWLVSVRADAWDEGGLALLERMGIQTFPNAEGFPPNPPNPYRSEKQ